MIVVIITIMNRINVVTQHDNMKSPNHNRYEKTTINGKTQQ